MFGISRVRDGGGRDDECGECSSLFLVNATIFFPKKADQKNIKVFLTNVFLSNVPCWKTKENNNKTKRKLKEFD